jgi:hypothetical protein
MDQKQTIALGIGLQTLVLKRCPLHRQVFYDDVDPSPAFALALELVNSRIPYVGAFDNDAHRLMDLLSEIIAAAPAHCSDCSVAGARHAPAARVRVAAESYSKV